SIPIVAYGADGAGRRLTRRAEDAEAIAVAPDGRELVAIMRRVGSSYVVVVSVPTGEERTLAEGDAAAFTPDGAEVIFSRGASALAVARGGGDLRHIADLPGAITDLKVGPDRSIHLAVGVADGLEAWRIAPVTGATSREAPPPWIEVVPAPA